MDDPGAAMNALRGLVLVAAVVAINVGVSGHDRQVDLSAQRRFSLAPETRALARSVRSPLRVTAFLNTSGAPARDARFLLSRFHEINRHITVSVIDPDANPSAARRYGIGTYSTVVLTSRGRRVDVASAEELDVATGILRLLRGQTRTVCLLTGHGEPSLDDTTPDGLSSIADLLRHNAYEAQSLDLTVGEDARVPDSCSAVLVIGPHDTLLPRETDALVAYAKAAGRLGVLASPLSNADPNPLISPWGLAFAGGLVLDPARSQGLDLSNLVVEDLPSASPVVEGVVRLQFPAAGGLLSERQEREGLTVARLAITSDRSWVETTPDQEISFTAGKDLPGPVLVAAAADDSRVEATGPRSSSGSVVRTRLFVTGSDTWADNRFLDKLGNRRLLVNALAWLTQTDQVVAAVSRPSTSRPLPLTAERQARILFVTVGVVPGVVVAGGLAPWLVARRRSRRR